MFKWLKNLFGGGIIPQYEPKFPCICDECYCPFGVGSNMSDENPNIKCMWCGGGIHYGAKK